MTQIVTKTHQCPTHKVPMTEAAAEQLDFQCGEPGCKSVLTEIKKKHTSHAAMLFDAAGIVDGKLPGLPPSGLKF